MRNIFITGANRGLGLALAKQSVESGHRVFAGTRHPSEPLALLGKQHRGLHPIIVDVTDEESIEAAGEAVAREVDRLDLIINNAGILFQETTMNPIERMDFDAAAQTLDVNSLGPLRVLKHFLPLLYGRPGTKVLNISSEAGSLADCRRDASYAYCMSKAALNMASVILQNYLREKGVKVLAVHPGWMRTRMGGQEGRYDPEESARAILALAEKDWRIDGPLFVDHTGAPLRW